MAPRFPFSMQMSLLSFFAGCAVVAPDSVLAPDSDVARDNQQACAAAKSRVPEPCDADHPCASPFQCHLGTCECCGSMQESPGRYYIDCTRGYEDFLEWADGDESRCVDVEGDEGVTSCLGNVGEPCDAGHQCQAPFHCMDGVCACCGSQMEESPGKLYTDCTRNYKDFINWIDADPTRCIGIEGAEGHTSGLGNVGEPCDINHPCQHPFHCDNGECRCCGRMEESPGNFYTDCTRNYEDFIRWTGANPSLCE